ncbi:hypothetical protein CHU98_g7723 [Xylaria longipes]|nr:hypothetical protein CHU98_g7723 [Xylaria longipes]
MSVIGVGDEVAHCEQIVQFTDVAQAPHQAPDRSLAVRIGGTCSRSQLDGAARTRATQCIYLLIGICNTA